MLLNILHHVPGWAFALLLALVVLGLLQTRPRSVTWRRSLVLPLALLALSFAGVVSAFGARPLALAAWAAGLMAAATALQGRVDPAAVRFSPATRVFEVPGSWVPLGLMMALFALKFGVGMSLGLHPQLRDGTGFMLAVSTAYGAFSGVFLGRAMALWALARSTARTRA